MLNGLLITDPAVIVLDSIHLYLDRTRGRCMMIYLSKMFAGELCNS